MMRSLKRKKMNPQKKTNDLLKNKRAYHLSELVIDMTQEFEESLAVSHLAVKVIFDSIKNQIRKGHRVEIRGLGSFELRSYSSYMGRNPKTGTAIRVKAKKLPFFKTGLWLKKHLNPK